MNIFTNTINTKLNNRVMFNLKQEQTYEQFNSNQLNNSLNLLSQTEEFVLPREPPLNFGMAELPLQNPTVKPIMNNNSLDFTTNLKLESNLQPFSEYVIQREPPLNFGMAELPLQNPTAKPIMNNNHLDYSTQLNLPNMNKNIGPNKTIISSNEIKEPIEKIQGVAMPHIPYDEYKKPNAYFNNFNDNGRSDITREYIVHVNSIDRDIIQYPSPFNFLVRCAPLGGDKNASISRIFENIRYIKVETAVLPLKYYLKKTISNNLPANILATLTATLPSSNDIIVDTGVNWVIIYAKDYTNATSTTYTDEYKKYANSKVIVYTQQILDYGTKMTECYEVIYKDSTPITYKYELSNQSIEKDKYTIMYLNDINDVSNFSTDINLSKAFNVLYPDLFDLNSLYVDCYYVEKIYKYSNLGNLDRMLLNLTNSMGKQLTTNLLAQDDKLSNFDNIKCTCTTDTDGNVVRDYKCICSYIRHPRYIYHQVNFMFKLGIIETDMNVRAFN